MSTAGAVRTALSVDAAARCKDWSVDGVWAPVHARILPVQMTVYPNLTFHVEGLL